ncbi:MAG TPA: glutamine synthetase family protein [Segeticoccus sp.]|uniref:glutamine synthetase family protein n=1 Tax=Segeticoccus sp. TaxID=2706531 RepID=UPI002D811257|nr:glutamine synthetase family protein [Segeticoccus sp.]HET8598853.1 glutamine synthetase family protein [Segeticoccus sp.]
MPPSAPSVHGEQADRLRSAGARLLAGVIVDSGGVLRAKAVAPAQIEQFAAAGMGASLTWPVFCVDGDIAMTSEIGVVGDLRLRADLSRAVVLDEGFAWAPADVYTQEGERSPLCWRDVARRQADRLVALGLSARAGFELEFTLLDAEGDRLGADTGWPGYGLGPLSTLSGFASTLAEQLDEAGVGVAQLHAEYGPGQFEVSLLPSDLLGAADAAVLARTVICRVARTCGLQASFSPMPFPDGAGNGAHVHFSFARDGSPLLTGGSEAADLTPEGAHLVAGLVSGLPACMAVLAGSVVSLDRLLPGHWSGAFGCWGVENREAAVRLIAANPGNPNGANVEVKCIDTAANPYLAVGLLVGHALQGLQDRAALPAAVSANPADLSAEDARAAGVVRLPTSLESAARLLEASPTAESILGEPLHRAVTAVRLAEAKAAEAMGDTRFHRTRMAWSA